MLCVYLGSDPDDFESEEKSDKIKSPNSFQSGKWQLGFQGDFILQNLKIWFLMVSEILGKSETEADCLNETVCASFK